MCSCVLHATSLLTDTLAAETGLTTITYGHFSQPICETMSEIMDFTERTSYQAVMAITKPTATPQCPKQEIWQSSSACHPLSAALWVTLAGKIKCPQFARALMVDGYLKWDPLHAFVSKSKVNCSGPVYCKHTCGNLNVRIQMHLLVSD